MLHCWQVQHVLKCNKQYKVNCSILQKVIHAGLLASSIRFEMQQAIQSKLFNTSEVNPFLSVHIPYVQSEGILPQIRLLQWRAYIFRNTHCFSTKLGRNMVNALFCHKTLKYWWPLTYIQGQVIQDGCQIQSEKSILGQKIAITRPIFWQIW